MLRQGQPGPIYISDIALTLQRRFGKTVDHVVFKTTSGYSRGVPVTISPGSQYKETFDPVLKLSIQDEVSITVHYPKRLLFCIPTHSAKTVVVKLSEVNTEAKEDQDERSVYTKFFNAKHVEVFIGLSISPQSLPSGVLGNPYGSVAIASSLPPHDTSPSSLHESNSPLPVSSESAYAAPSEVAVPGPAPLEQSQATAASHEDTHRGDHLTPVTSDILKICPRFRLLVIGNSGVGKSTLIRKVFGVEDVNVGNEKRGQADIDREFIAKDNGLFVVHDSLGLEPGDDSNLNIIKTFINKRQAMTDIKDRLHAVWVCLPVPYAKGRLLETGMENFLRQKKDILGDIPIVIVLTKLDMLDQQLLYEASKKGTVKTLEEALAKANAERPNFLETYCAKPLQAVADGVPRVPVSVLGGLVSTIPLLVKTTNHEIEQYITGKPVPRVGVDARSSFDSLERKAQLYVAGMAQRVSIEDNIDLTINIGKRRYWNDLTATMTFPEEKVKEYLLNIHEDIIQTCNYNDPNEILRSDDFKAAMISASNLVADVGQDGRTSLDDDNVIHTLGDVIINFTKVAIVLPVTGPAQLAKFIAEAYRAPQLRVKCFMTYITDFVYVMKILFVVSQQGPITTENAALALEVYKESYQKRIHFEIRDFCENYRKPGRDTAMEQVERMIRRYPITDDDVAQLQKRVEEKTKVAPSG